MFYTDLADLLPFWNVLFWPGETCSMIIIATPGKMCDMK